MAQQQPTTTINTHNKKKHKQQITFYKRLNVVAVVCVLCYKCLLIKSNDKTTKYKKKLSLNEQ